MDQVLPACCKGIGRGCIGYHIGTVETPCEEHRNHKQHGRAAKTGIWLFTYLEQNPIIDIRKTSDDLGLAYCTVSATVNRFVETSILEQTNNASRNRVFAYTEYMDILRKDT